jgi:tRNA threonylcarbamoyladenosine biosynthesis protein TsaE
MKLTYSLPELTNVAQSITARLAHKTVLFYGAMGVGKTTLIKQMAAALGVTETLSSPTFSIVNEYEIAGDALLYHFDCYRITNETEALDFGIEEYLGSDHFNFIEWPERIEGLLHQNVTKIELTKNQDGTRTLKITPVN